MMVGDVKSEASHRFLEKTTPMHFATRKYIEAAEENGAECIAVGCPLCQANLDMYQSNIEEETGEQLGVPILYFTQLMGLAMGLDLDDIMLDKVIVDPLPLMIEKGFVEGKVYL